MDAIYLIDADSTDDNNTDDNNGCEPIRSMVPSPVPPTALCHLHRALVTRVVSS